MTQIHYETATFGAGCFWGVESAFKELKGVRETSVGFMGGRTANPSYKDVCYNNTGHAEVVHLLYDPKVVTYKQLLKTFFETHNPTEVNRQGPDVGDQYRSVIFYHNDKQKMLAEEAIAKLEESKLFKQPIATEVTKASEFYMAEDYHQDYYTKKGVTPHCGFGIGVSLDFITE